ncbi:MAG: hypothetical protein VX755_11115, partial [Pseudomonadota bacterium]|nr:hypothetical protein [Pseudomonadota bacterium]
MLKDGGAGRRQVREFGTALVEIAESVEGAGQAQQFGPGRRTTESPRVASPDSFGEFASMLNAGLGRLTDKQPHIRPVGSQFSQEVQRSLDGRQEHHGAKPSFVQPHEQQYDQGRLARAG